MGGTRGTHLVMDMPELTASLGGRMLYFETEDHRACLALPLDKTHVYIGTTDIRAEDPGDKQFTEQEVDYIFEVMRPILPGVTFRREDIVFAMAGVRPLPYQKVAATGAISRDHRLDVFPPTDDRPFETFTLVGGKWTTYRAFGEQVTDAVLRSLGRDRKTSTAELKIGGAQTLPYAPDERAAWIAELAAETRLGEDRCATLVSRYGGNARAVAEAERDSNASFEAVEGYTPAEIDLICGSERVTRLEDVVLRRTLMGFEGRISRPALQEVAAVAATRLGWDAETLEREIAQTAELVQRRHRVPMT